MPFYACSRTSTLDFRTRVLALNTRICPTGLSRTELDMPRVTLRISFAIVLLATLSCQWASAQSRSSRLPLSSGYAPDGVLEPWRISDVACVESGLVKSFHVKLGQRVQAGDVVAKIDSASVQMQLRIAEAQAASVGRQSSAKAEVELNERKVQAIRNARQNQFSSQSELERAEADLKIALGRLSTELEDQEIMRLQVARLNQQIAQRTVLAPIDGIVVELHKELGEFVSPANPEILRIVDVSRLRASFFLQIHEVAPLTQGEQVAVALNGGPQVVAEIEHIAPVADSESGLIEVRVLIDNPESKILGSRCTLLLDSPLPANASGA